MAEVERDAYELETSLAEKNLQAMYDSLLRVESALRETGEESENVEGASKKMAAGVFMGNLAFEAAKRAVDLFTASLKEGVEGVLEAQRANAQLRLVAGEATEALSAQAEQMERAFGVSAEAVKRSQVELLRFGVARSQVEGVTRAINDYAVATGKDLLEATREVTKAVENGGGKLENLGITFKATGRAGHDMAAAADAISKKFGGAAAADADTLAGRAKLVQNSFDELKKSFGGLVVDFASNTGILDDLRLALEGLNIALFGSDQEEHWNKLSRLYDEQAEALAEIADAETDLMVAKAAGDARMMDGATAILTVEKQNLAAIREQIAALRGRNEVVDEGKPEERETKFGANEREEEEKASAARREALAKGFAKNEEELEKKKTEALKSELEIRERDFQESEELRNRAKEDALTERERKERHFSSMSVAHASETTKALARTVYDAFEPQTLTQRIEGSLVDAIRNISRGELSAAYASSVVQPLVDTLKESAMQLADVIAFQPLEEFLTTNQAYSEAYMEASIERRQAELAEQGIIKTTGELRVEAEEEASNAQKKRLAETLAQMALESGKQALFQVAEGIGNLAAYRYDAAALNFAAAAAYGVIAGAAGGAAYAITQSRGQTTQERESLEALKRRDEKKNEREKKNRSAAADEGIGTQVNVFNLGITGQTRTAQARELNRIQREYGALSIGGP